MKCQNFRGASTNHGRGTTKHYEEAQANSRARGDPDIIGNQQCSKLTHCPSLV